MIDLHTHLLPCIDDGSRSLSESIETLKLHASQGCTAVVCTPHISPAYPNSESSIKQKYHELKEAVSELSLDVTIHYGAEYAVGTLFEKIVNDEPLIFLNSEDDPQRYLLVEFPFAVRPLWLDQLFDYLAGNTIGIVVAHPERYGNFDILKALVNRGECLFALNLSSILGEEGARVRKNAFSFISRQGARIILSSDAHPALQRFPQFDRLGAFLQRKLPPMIVDYWCTTLPQKILRGEEITELDNAIINLYADHLSVL